MRARLDLLGLKDSGVRLAQPIYQPADQAAVGGSLGPTDVHADVHVIDRLERGALRHAASVKHLYEVEVRVSVDVLLETLAKELHAFAASLRFVGREVDLGGREGGEFAVADEAAHVLSA